MLTFIELPLLTPVFSWLGYDLARWAYGLDETSGLAQDLLDPTTLIPCLVALLVGVLWVAAIVLHHRKSVAQRMLGKRILGDLRSALPDGAR